MRLTLTQIERASELYKTSNIKWWDIEAKITQDWDKSWQILQILDIVAKINLGGGDNDYLEMNLKDKLNELLHSVSMPKERNDLELLEKEYFNNKYSDELIINDYMEESHG
jgi:hypothetical protein